MTKFYKYQGAGNDFIIIDNRAGNNILDKKTINHLCHRHFGIGADGLILLENDTNCDFKMVYFNADGNQSTMCGNGGRCIVRFAHDLAIINDYTTFMAIDGLHEAFVTKDVIKLKMIDVAVVERHQNHYFINTGSPHHVQFVAGLDSFDVKNKGKEIRYGSPYFQEGANVNFVEKMSENSIKVRTYERGVEDETYACGTGVTAAAIASFVEKKVSQTVIDIETLGGKLNVCFDAISDQKFNNIYLTGPAIKVFEGNLET